MNDMWEALERYQPYADKHGFGAEWKRMTTERTAGAAWASEAAAWAEAAMRAEDAAARAAAWMAARRAEYAAARSIKYVNKAIKLEGER